MEDIPGYEYNFCDLIHDSVKSYEFNGNGLRFYFNDKKNYLLYKKIDMK